jgi:hypothetical protein
VVCSSNHRGKEKKAKEYIEGEIAAAGLQDYVSQY